MKLDIKIQNLDRVRDALAKLSGPQAKVAYAKAINDTGFMVRKAMQAELGKFDRVTPFILKSPKLLAATPDKLSARIIPTMESRNVFVKGGKVGVDPQHVLQAQEFGGRRADKRSESALRSVGILPSGYQTAIPKDPYPGSDDGRGNLRGVFLQQLLSYLQVYQRGNGFGGNMSKEAKDRLHKYGRSKISKRAQQQPGPFIGRRYFVAGTEKVLQIYEGTRQRITNRPRKGTGHLQPGIWAVQRGELKPVLIFVRTPSYKPRISMERIARDSGAQDYLDKRVRFRVRQLAEDLAS